jgi:hypothetical protein
MKKKDPSDPSLWEYNVRIGHTGEELFRFIRDRDPEQMIYPSEEKATDPSINVLGPDALGEDLHWMIRGAIGESVKICLSVKEGEIKVTTASKVIGETTWQSLPPTYFILGSFTGWYYMMMDEDEEGMGVHRCRFAIGEECREFFQIAAEQDPRRSYYPSYPDCQPGEGLVQGPDAGGAERWFQVNGSPGQEVEVTLDLLAEDKRNIVLVRAVMSSTLDVEA